MLHGDKFAIVYGLHDDKFAIVYGFKFQHLTKTFKKKNWQKSWSRLTTTSRSFI